MRIVPVSLVVSLMTFLITRATSGDPVQIMLGMQTSPEAAAAMRAEFNLDRSVPEQYFLWLGHVLTGDFGVSTEYNLPVTSVLRSGVGPSLSLTVPILLGGTLIGHTAWN